jgi:predicted metal-dependent TIM-barrel fold hydrolase
MIFIEPHIHMLSRTTDDYQRMYAAGIRVCVEPSFWLGTPRRYPGSYLDYFSLILDGEEERARKFGIDHYANIAFNPKEAENIELAEETIALMDEYWDHPRCLAIGEVGFNNITENEEKVHIRQVRIAMEKNLPIMIHTPHIPKVEGTKKSIEILKAEGVPPERAIIDHNTEQTMPISYPEGYWCGMTIYPYSKLAA